MSDRNQNGSVFLGILIGFFFHLLGLILALFLAKPKTKRGALIGFVLFLTLIISLTVFTLVLGRGMMNGRFDQIIDMIESYMTR